MQVAHWFYVSLDKTTQSSAAMGKTWSGKDFFWYASDHKDDIYLVLSILESFLQLPFPLIKNIIELQHLGLPGSSF